MIRKLIEQLIQLEILEIKIASIKQNVAVKAITVHGNQSHADLYFVSFIIAKGL